MAFILDKGNGVQCIQKLNGLGWYQPSPSGGRTTDPNGRVISFGNVLASYVADLLYTKAWPPYEKNFVETYGKNPNKSFVFECKQIGA